MAAEGFPFGIILGAMVLVCLAGTRHDEFSSAGLAADSCALTIYDEGTDLAINSV
jgi:hypothetical protein